MKLCYLWFQLTVAICSLCFLLTEKQEHTYTKQQHPRSFRVAIFSYFPSLRQGLSMQLFWLHLHFIIQTDSRLCCNTRMSQQINLGITQRTLQYSVPLHEDRNVHCLCMQQFLPFPHRQTNQGFFKSLGISETILPVTWTLHWLNFSTTLLKNCCNSKEIN